MQKEARMRGRPNKQSFVCPECGHEWSNSQYECLRCGHKWYGRLPSKPKICANLKCQSKYWDRPRKPQWHCNQCGHEWYPIERTVGIPQHCPNQSCLSYSWRERLFSPEEKLWRALTGSEDNVPAKEQIFSMLESALSPREMTVIVLRYGLDGNRMRTLETIGDMFGVTRERIRQIEAGSLRKLRKVLRGESRGLRVSDSREV